MRDEVGKPERQTQERIIGLFETLGYTYLGDWTERHGCEALDAPRFDRISARRLS